MGDNARPTLTQGDLQDFMLENRYGVTGPGIRWPQKTILLCKCIVETDSGELIQITDPPLKRFDNQEGEHAEIVMIKYFRSRLPILKQGFKVKLSMIASYSPCKNCSDAIVEFMSQFKASSVEIKFSNFYKCYESDNVTGLRNLIGNGVQLSVFSGKNDWITLIRDQLGLDPNLVDELYTTEREDRERVDSRILQIIHLDTELHDLVGRR